MIIGLSLVARLLVIAYSALLGNIWLLSTAGLGDCGG
jgi:hypothetical protein